MNPQHEAYCGHVNSIGIRACYDEGKRCAETLFFDYYRQHGVDIRVARIFNTYGPRMHPNDGRVVFRLYRGARSPYTVTVAKKPMLNQAQSIVEAVVGEDATWARYWPTPATGRTPMPPPRRRTARC